MAGGHTNMSTFCHQYSWIQNKEIQHFQRIYMFLFKKIFYNIHHCQEALDPDTRMCLNTIWKTMVTMYYLPFITFTPYYINFHFRLQLHNTVRLCKHYSWKVTAVYEICWVHSRIYLANWILSITFWSVIFFQLLYCSI